LKLIPQLVPKPLWRKSAAELFGRTALWMRIRSDALKGAHHACEICCNATTRLVCHEVWHYDDRQGIAMLAGLEIHCDKCDAATHMGLAVRRGKRDMAIAQLCEINGIRLEEAEQLFGDAMILWRKRNEKQWRIVVAKQLLVRYPQLAALESAWSRRRGEIPR
jgi:hypothetical protein